MSEAPFEADYDLIATSIIRHLLGKRMTWPPIRVVDAYPVNRELILSGRPVSEVISVTVVNSRGDETVLDEANYRVDSRFRIRISSSVALPVPQYYDSRCRPEIHVDYVFGSEPPMAVQAAIEYYSEQLSLAASGDAACKLPKRVTSIARQGINMTILDPMDYLEKGRTGLPEVDSVIAVYNPGRAKARARLFTEKNPPPRRLSAVAVDPDDVFGEDGDGGLLP